MLRNMGMTDINVDDLCSVKLTFGFSYSWDAFKNCSNLTWALSITSLIIVLPLIMEVRWDFALADQEKYFELQQKGYTHQQIEQMMGQTIPTGPSATA